MGEPYIGEIRMMGFAFPPRGWVQCNGQLLPINQNQPLFSLLGTMYGGDGRTTFALPDLRGRTPIHAGNGVRQGERGGEERHVLTVAEVPRHQHVVQATAQGPDGGGGNTPAPSKTLSATGTGQLYGRSANVQPMSAQAIGATGGSLPHPNMMPYTVVGMCICIAGIYPPRD